MLISIIKILLISLWTLFCSFIAFAFLIFDRSLRLYFWLSHFFSGGILKISLVKVEKSGLLYRRWVKDKHDTDGFAGREK